MKEISRKEIEQQVREELKEARAFCSYGYGRYYTMMIDLSDGSIWSDHFLDCETWKEYHSETIVRLSTNGMIDNVDRAYIDDAVDKLTTAGWIVKK